MDFIEELKKTLEENVKKREEERIERLKKYRDKTKKYYVYFYKTKNEKEIEFLNQKILIKKGEIFYVGKGTGKRAYDFKNHNELTKLFINIFDVEVIVHEKDIDEHESFELESAYIWFLGSEKKKILTNRLENYYFVDNILFFLKSEKIKIHYKPTYFQSYKQYVVENFIKGLELSII